MIYTLPGPFLYGLQIIYTLPVPFLYAPSRDLYAPSEDLYALGSSALFLYALFRNVYAPKSLDGAYKKNTGRGTRAYKSSEDLQGAY